MGELYTEFYIKGYAQKTDLFTKKDVLIGLAATTTFF